MKASHGRNDAEKAMRQESFHFIPEDITERKHGGHAASRAAFRKGDKIGLLLGAAHVDLKKFTDPNVFRPTRDEGANVSFGAGLHFCIGAPLARLELNLSLPILFRRLPNMRLKNEPEVKDAFHFHGLERLDLVW